MIMRPFWPWDFLLEIKSISLNKFWFLASLTYSLLTQLTKDIQFLEQIKFLLKLKTKKWNLKKQNFMTKVVSYFDDRIPLSTIKISQETSNLSPKKLLSSKLIAYERKDLGQKIFDFELSGTACFKLVFYRNFLTIGGLNSCKVKW